MCRYSGLSLSHENLSSVQGYGFASRAAAVRSRAQGDHRAVGQPAHRPGLGHRRADAVVRVYVRPRRSALRYAMSTLATVGCGLSAKAIRNVGFHWTRTWPGPTEPRPSQYRAAGLPAGPSRHLEMGATSPGRLGTAWPFRRTASRFMSDSRYVSGRSHCI